MKSKTLYIKAYQESRTARMNIKYFGWLLFFWSSVDQAFRFITVVVPALAAAGLFALSGEEGPGSWRWLVVAAAGAGALSVALGPGDKIKAYSSLRQQWVQVRLDAERLFMAQAINLDAEASEASLADFERLRHSMVSIARDEPAALQWLLRRAQAEVSREEGLDPGKPKEPTPVGAG